MVTKRSAKTMQLFHREMKQNTVCSGCSIRVYSSISTNYLKFYKNIPVALQSSVRELLKTKLKTESKSDLKSLKHISAAKNMQFL